MDGLKAMNDIMNVLFLKLLEDKISDKPEKGKIDLLNKEYYQSHSKLDKWLEYLSLKNLLKLDLKDLINSDDLTLMLLEF